MTRGSTGPALTGLKPHLLACSRLHVSPGEHSQALTRVHLCSGTIVISEPSYRIFLHKLVLDPEPQLHRTADLQGPERCTAPPICRGQSRGARASKTTMFLSPGPRTALQGFCSTTSLMMRTSEGSSSARTAALR